MAFSNEITASDILTGSGEISSADIADGAVIATKVAIDAINTANIVNGAVTSADIAAAAVGTTQLANGAVTNPIMGAASVSSGNIIGGAVGTTQLATGAVTNPILAAVSVAAGNIINGAVGTIAIANGAVGTTQIANAAITNALIANGAIGTAQIQTAAITTALIATAAITDALIANVSASKITAGTISASISITSPTINGGTITGALFRTAASGQRFEMSSSTINAIFGYSGGAGESAPGGLTVDAAGDLFLNSCNVSGGTQSSIRCYAPSPLGPSNLANRIVMIAPNGIQHNNYMSWEGNRVYTNLINDTNHYMESGGGNALWQAYNSLSLRTTQFDVQEQVGAGSAVCRTVNFAASGYREHDASTHANLSDIRFKDVHDASGVVRHAEIVRKVGRPFLFKWKEGHGDNGRCLRWGHDATTLPAEFTKRSTIDGETVHMVDPQSMIAALFGAVADLVDDIAELRERKQ